VQEVATEGSEQISTDLNRWEDFLEAVREMTFVVENSQAQLDDLISSGTPARKQLQTLDDMSVANQDHILRSAELLNIAHEIARDFPGENCIFFGAIEIS